MVDTRADDGSNIVIIGFMATGKTTLGKELSKSLGMKFLDADKIIEEKVEMTIPEIFGKHGEEYFRLVEKETIKDISKSQDKIVSCGGGVCLDPENIRNIKKMGKVVLLEADPETISGRIKNDISRPLLKDKDKIEEIKKIMDERRDSYHKSADIIIDTSEKNVFNIIDEILGKLNL